MALKPVRVTVVDLVVTGGHRYTFPCLRKPQKQGTGLSFFPADTNEDLAVYGGVEEDDIIFLYTYSRTEMVEVSEDDKCIDNLVSRPTE